MIENRVHNKFNNERAGMFGTQYRLRTSELQNIDLFKDIEFAPKYFDNSAADCPTSAELFIHWQ